MCIRQQPFRDKGGRRSFRSQFPAHHESPSCWTRSDKDRDLGGRAGQGRRRPQRAALDPTKKLRDMARKRHNQSKPWGKRDVRVEPYLTLVELMLRMAEAAEADQLGAHQHQEILIAELNHRIRNILALVRGLVTQSAAASTNDHATFVKSFDARIRSLARSHDLLTSNFWKPASFHALVKAEIATYGAVDKRLSLIGPDVLLEPKAFTTWRSSFTSLSPTRRDMERCRDSTPGSSWKRPKRHAKYFRFLARNRRPSRVTAQTTGIWQHSFGATRSLRAQQSQPSHVSSARFCYGPGPAGDVSIHLEAFVENALMEKKEIAPVEAVTFPELLLHLYVVEDNLFIAIDTRDVEELKIGVIIVTKSVADTLVQIASKIFVSRCWMSISARRTASSYSIAKKKQHPLLFRHRLRRWSHSAQLNERRADRLEAVQQSIVHRCFAAVSILPGARRIDG